MPADEELVVGREHRLVEHVHRRFQQGRMDTLEDHAALAGKGAGHRPFGIAARQLQVDELLRQCRRGGKAGGTERGMPEKAATAGLTRQFGVEIVHDKALLWPATLADRRGVSQVIGPTDPIIMADQFGVAMQGETNRLPRHAPASVLAPTSSHIAASATVSTVPTKPKKPRFSVVPRRKVATV